MDERDRTHSGCEPGSGTEAATDQASLLRALRNPRIFGPGTRAVTLLETHISYVLLTGEYAYKIRKAVNLEFLDFTTLAARQHDCQEELRLNHDLAPSIYLDVVAITGTIADPMIGGDGPALEYAVRMRQFQRDALLSDLLARGTLAPSHIDELAGLVADFHARTRRAAADMPYGRPDDVLQPARQNFTQLCATTDAPRERIDLDALQAWTETEYEACVSIFAARRRQGFVRECHGDLHLGNIVLIEGSITLFDRLEFNESMRWIDVMNDVAFVVMDLQERSRRDLAARFLTAYLEATGDYDGLSVLPFYLVYRSMVRAKVARLRVSQLGAPADRAHVLADGRAYLELARRQSRRAAGAIVITHGLPGSGKTTYSQAVVENLEAVRIRTDIERKRLHGLGALASSQSGVGGGLYTTEATDRTYAHMCALAREVVAAGYVVVVDGAFLQHRHRQLFREAAVTLHVPFVIMSLSASASTLQSRILHRHEQADDASEATLAVLERRRTIAEPLAVEEQPFVVHCDSSTSMPVACSEIVARHLDRIQSRLSV
jgi:hypothetical protein